ncbi:hypothetical protein AAZX31_01G019400 [Glycine max]|uniref:Myb-like domain-containing protein n=1 Tax=Glycine max TaxID=3847 RepID=K7K1B9_SOYBN|nr:uncharacterized protein LOC100777884 [Glycine max]KAG5059159.1 hypothetical protein JHK87_000188 [Glycine soja]KAG5067807.1 hypothetical protein JHK85_000184 [Glycine max]KAG5087569.1 hypothetical protein JHK86_000181 [Glycine max]KAH1161201.1 hypothetical protein GYH30_000199 [Glycine max]KAH1264223.1 hypothetical protein GmHk_01G000184 [Glycine max]|eukprot:XP_003517681.1 uncharacterized protein LOC100777884 [Glycine max]
MPARNFSVHTPRRSPRFLPQQNHDTPNPKSAKLSVSANKSEKCAVGSRRSPRLNNVEEQSPPLRRSPMLNNEPVGKQLKGTRVKKGGVTATKENRVVSDEGFGGGRKKERNRKRVEVETQESVVSDEGFGGGIKKERNRKRVEVGTQENGVVSDEGFGGGRKKERNWKRVKVKTKENRVVLDEGIGGGAKKEENGKRVKTKANRVVSDEGFGGGRKKGENGEKRKRGGEEISKGWTKEQELALQRAYFAAKPSPHFWKNVSKLVPGKSQQDCFDRIHCDYMTPPQTQPHSRAKTLKSSPIHQFSISASKLLKPIDKTVRKSNVLKPKNIITQKSIEKLLQHHLKVDLDREVDIFSVLEPNTDFSTNALQPSEALSTPKQQKENKGFLQNCTETSSSSHKKPLSRFSGSCVTELVSPPVLKKVKNRVMHEKYINQLRCRESRRRAAATKIIGEGTSIQKRDVVKGAKVALVSEARDAINKFQQSQVNLMDNTCSSDEDNGDGVEFEDESQ